MSCLNCEICEEWWFCHGFSFQLSNCSPWFILWWNFWSYIFLTVYVYWNSILRDISYGCQINKVKICNICIIEKANLFEILWKYKEGISTLLFFNLTETCLRRILKAYPRILNKRKTCANWFLTLFSFKRTAKSYQR